MLAVLLRDADYFNSQQPRWRVHDGASVTSVPVRKHTIHVSVAAELGLLLNGVVTIVRMPPSLAMLPANVRGWREAVGELLAPVVFRLA